MTATVKFSEISPPGPGCPPEQEKDKRCTQYNVFGPHVQTSLWLRFDDDKWMRRMTTTTMMIIMVMVMVMVIIMIMMKMVMIIMIMMTMTITITMVMVI